MNKKLNELRAMSVTEMNVKLAALKNELAKEQSVKATNTRPENPGKARSIRRQIARIMTFTRQKQPKGEVSL